MQSAAQKEIILDATGSTSPLKLPLTYTVTPVAPPGGSNIPQGSVVNAVGNGMVSITFTGGKGVYSYLVTALDTAGNTSSQTVTFTYYGL